MEHIKRGRGRPPLQAGESTTSICVRVPNPVYDRATKKASADRVSVPELVRRAITDLLKDERSF